MNKKQEMVNQLLDRIEKAGVVYSDELSFDETTLRSRKDFWGRHPDGYYNDSISPSVEGQLSCLSEDSLQRILVDDKIKSHMIFGDLWRTWGRAGYFVCEPEIIHHAGHHPILRLRHDCYLAWFRDAGFQNSHDAYCHGSNGASAMDIDVARRAIDIPPNHSLFWNEAGKELDAENVIAGWNINWALFRKAMYVSYPVQAMCGKSVFRQTLDNKPALFEQFLNITDAECAHFDIQSDLTLEDMRKQAEANEFTWLAVAEIPIVMDVKGCVGPQVFAMLRLSEHKVSLSWSEDGIKKSLTIPFPEWEKEAWRNEARTMDLACETPQCLPQRDYLYTCWVNLSFTLLMLARIDASNYWAMPAKGAKFDFAPLLFTDEKHSASGINEIGSICYELSQEYPGRKELIKELHTGSSKDK